HSGLAGRQLVGDVSADLPQPADDPADEGPYRDPGAGRHGHLVDERSDAGRRQQRRVERYPGSASHASGRFPPAAPQPDLARHHALPVEAAVLTGRLDRSVPRDYGYLDTTL